jgi:hypothetical protein
MIERMKAWWRELTTPVPTQAEAVVRLRELMRTPVGKA